MNHITIAANQAKLLKQSTAMIESMAKMLKDAGNPFDSAELIINEVKALEFQKKASVVEALWQGVKSLNGKEPENEFEKFYGLQIQIIPGIKAWRLITGDNLAEAADAVKAIRDELHNGTIKFPHL